MKIQVFQIASLQTNGASCSLLQIEDPKHEGKKLQIMLDCGINQKLERDRLKHYQKKIQKSHLVLLSQGSIEYCGGIPIIINSGIISQKTQIFATSPVVDFGYRNFIDQFMNIQQQFLKDPLTTEEEDKNKQEDDFKRVIKTTEESFQKVQRLNFGQKQELTFLDNIFKVSIWPVRAGKTIGCCAWRICVNMINLISVSDFSMNKELHIDQLAVDKLISVSDQSQLFIIKTLKAINNITRQQLDLLLVNNISIIKEKANCPPISIKDAITQALYQSPQGMIILTFYPNERILEGIMAIDQIIYDHPELKGLKANLYANYNDIIDKARGQTDFLGHSLVNWKYQDQKFNQTLQQLLYSHQTPLDPEYLKNRFLNMINFNQIEDEVQPRCKIVLTTHNSLFHGPFSRFLQPLLQQPYNIVMMFGQPFSALTDSIRGLKNGFRGQLDCRLKEQETINFNAIKKLLLQKTKDVNNQDEKQEITYSDVQQGLTQLSTTYRSGQFDSQSQSADPAKSIDKMTEESFPQSKTVQQLEPIQEEEDLFQKTEDYKQFPIKFPVNLLMKGNKFYYNMKLDQIVFQDRQESKPNQIRPSNELFTQEYYGITPPSFVKLEISQITNYLFKNKEKFLFESESEGKSEGRSEGESAKIPEKIQEVHFNFPKKIVPQSPYCNFEANLIVHQDLVPPNVFSLLVNQLNPIHLHFLNPSGKKIQIDNSDQFALSVQQQNSVSDVMMTISQIELNLIQADQSELKESVIKVHLRQSIKSNQGDRNNFSSIRIQRKCTQGNYQVGKGQQSQLLYLFKHLMNSNIDCLLGFGQISIERNQIIITKKPEGFHLEGVYGSLYSKIRQQILNFYSLNKL